MHALSSHYYFQKNCSEEFLLYSTVLHLFNQVFNTVCFDSIKRHGTDMDEIFFLSTYLLCVGDWASQRESWLNRVGACSNLKPISRLLQHRNEAVLFSTCLRCCSLIDTALWSTERSASWYKVMPVSYQQTFIPWLQSPPTVGTSLWGFCTKNLHFHPLSSYITMPSNNHLRPLVANRSNFLTMPLFIAQWYKSCQEFTEVLFLLRAAKGLILNTGLPPTTFQYRNHQQPAAIHCRCTDLCITEIMQADESWAQTFG